MPLLRDLNELHPVVLPRARLWLAACAVRGLPLLVIETRRTMAVARAYWVTGRMPLKDALVYYAAAGLRPIKDEDNKIITKAKPGQSWHQYGCALDFAPLVNGQIDWVYDPEFPADHWDEIADEAKKVGFKWGGDWRTFKDRPHVEYHSGWEHPDEAATWVAEHADDWRIPLTG